MSQVDKELWIAAAVEQLAAARTTNSVVAVLRSCTRDLIGADGVAVILKQGDECHYIAEDAISPLWQGRHFPVSECLSGWVMTHGKTAVVADILKDARVPQEAYSETFVRSAALVPIGRPEAIAALGAYWRHRDAPTASSVGLLEALGRAASTAFENLRLMQSLQASREHEKLLANELNHRLQNTFTVVSALAFQTLKGEGASLDAARDRFLSRLDAIAAAHRRLVTDTGSSDIASIVAGAVDPLNPQLSQVKISGPEVMLRAPTATSLTLGLHELATNALKYGALSVPSGSIKIKWSIEPGERGKILKLVWRESGGPLVRRPSRRGFGTRMIEGSLAHELGAAVSIKFEPAGIVAHLTAELIEGASITNIAVVEVA